MSLDDRDAIREGLEAMTERSFEGVPGTLEAGLSQPTIDS